MTMRRRAAGILAGAVLVSIFWLFLFLQAIFGQALAQTWLPLSSVPAPTVWMDFAGNYSTGCSGAFTNCLSVTNDGHGTATTLGGTVVSFSANTLRITDQGLLIEEARTNTIFPSIPNWTLSNVSIATNSVSSPDGSTTGSKITDSATNTAHSTFGAGFNTNSGVTYTASVYIFPGTLQYVSLRGELVAPSTYGWLTLDTVNGTITNNGVAGVTFGVTKYNNGWFRVWQIFTSNQTIVGSGNIVVAGSDVASAPATNSTLGNSYVGTGKTFYIWGGQFEVGSFPTSYIPTTTVAVTRAADVVQALSPLANALTGSAGSIVVKTNLSQQSAAATFLAANGIVLLGKNAGNNGTTAVGATLNTSNTGTWTSANDLGLAWNAAGGIINLNVIATTDGVARTPASPIFVGATSGSSAFINGYIQSIAAFNSKLATPQ